MAIHMVSSYAYRYGDTAEKVVGAFFRVAPGALSHLFEVPESQRESQLSDPRM